MDVSQSIPDSTIEDSPRSAPAVRSTRRESLRYVGIAYFSSRLFVLACGVIAAAVRGWNHSDGGVGAAQTMSLAEPFGHTLNVLVAGSSRWDSTYYEAMSTLGIGASPHFAGFYPGYPFLMRAFRPIAGIVTAGTSRQVVISGIVISLAAFAVALYLLHRLVILDFGTAIANRVVLLVAWFPMAFFFSAIYTESLFLALSVGSIYMARRGRWAAAGLIGGATVFVRATGFLLLVPLGLLFLYGPRADRPPAPARGWRPRYSWRSREVAWLAAVPAGVALYLLDAYQTYGNALASDHAQQVDQDRHFRDPVSVIFHGLHDAEYALSQVLLHHANPITNTPDRTSLSNFGFVMLAFVVLIAAFRAIPFAYWAYALVALALPFLDSPAIGAEHWNAMPRYMMVAFPLFIWIAIWCHRRWRWWAVMGVSALLLAFFTSLFATYHWVA